MMLNNSIKRLLGMASLAVGVLMLSPMASAVVLTPGSGTTVLTDFSGITLGTLVGSLNSPYTAVAAVGQQTGGTLYSRAYSGDSGASGIDFFFEVTNTAGIADAVSQLTFNGFGGFITDVGFRTTPVDGINSGTVAPSGPGNIAFRGSGANGNTVGFNFGSTQQGTIAPGLASDILVIRTNATGVTTNQTGVADGITVNVPSLAPAPEPASIVFFGSCLLGMAGFMRRRNSGTQLS